ncbi:MAG: hypothetical protein WC519_00055 [Parcubacteria group bacterium]
MAETLEKQPISSTDLILKTWEKMVSDLKGKIISLPTDPTAEIANDSDVHRTRIGYMRYTHVALVKVQGENFLLARGIKHGQYPAEPYDSDLTACPLNEEDLTDDEAEFLAKANDVLSYSSYFAHSLVFTKMDGDLMVSDSHFARSVIQKVQTIGPGLVAVQPEYGDDLLSTTLTPVVNRTTKYYPEAPEKLAKALTEVLAESRS